MQISARLARKYPLTPSDCKRHYEDRFGASSGECTGTHSNLYWEITITHASDLKPGPVLGVFGALGKPSCAQLFIANYAINIKKVLILLNPKWWKIWRDIIIFDRRIFIVSCSYTNFVHHPILVALYNCLVCLVLALALLPATYSWVLQFTSHWLDIGPASEDKVFYLIYCELLVGKTRSSKVSELRLKESFDLDLGKWNLVDFVTNMRWRHIILLTQRSVNNYFK